jgi:nucleoside-diphosphate-sugar epimerase
VYGPRDMLFLHNMLKTRMLRIFGHGKNKCSFTHVDNYCHALILGEKALYKGSPALGKFYIATDGPPQVGSSQILPPVVPLVVELGG